MRYILSGGVLADGLHYKIDVNAMSCRLSKDGCETSERETFSSLIMELNRMGITWGVPFESDNKGLWLCIADYTFEDGVRLEQQLEDRLKSLPQIREWRGDYMTNGTNEFLKLNADPNYYRFNLFGLLTYTQWPLPDADLSNFESACKEVAKYLSGCRGVEVEWGYGSAEHDKGTEFENDGGWYLFFKVSDKQTGENFEQDTYSYFNCPGAYESEDGYEY